MAMAPAAYGGAVGPAPVAGPSGANEEELQGATAAPWTGNGRPKDGKRNHKGKFKALYFWTTDDVNKWLKKHGGYYYKLYGDIFLQHDINGRAMARMTDIKLQMIGITNARHREELMRHILRLKLKTEAQELKTLDQKVSFDRK